MSIGAALLAWAGTAQAQSQWIETPTKAARLGGATTVLGGVPGTLVVRVAVALKLHDKAGLDQLVRPLLPGNAAGSAQAERFLPSVAESEAVASYLRRAGFSNVRITPDRLLVRAEGPPSAVQAAFNTALVRIVHRGAEGDVEGIANTQPAQLPPALAGTVTAVLGLRTAGSMHRTIAAPGGMGRVSPSAVCPGSGTYGLSPLVFQYAYGATSLPAAGGTAVAIIADGNLAPTVAALHTFESQNGLQTIQPFVDYVDRFNNVSAGECEYDIDSQTIQGTAGGYLGSLTFYVAPTLDDDDLSDTIHQAEFDGTAKTINMSLAECEADAKADNSAAVDDAFFELGLLKGQTFAVSSGDDGARECDGAAGVTYPSSSPYVIAIGGTTLSLSGNAYAGETAWSGSGGGFSAFEPKPAWQMTAVGGNVRALPDLAFDGDPQTGILVVTSGGKQGPLGGTSLSAPIFVGLFARMQTAAGGQLPFPAQWIYHFPVGRRGAAFHDITAGSNGTFSAAPGWDAVTGFGSLNASIAYRGLRGLSGPSFLTYLLDPFD